MTEADVPAEIDWTDGSHLTIWRFYVGEKVKAIWAELPVKVRIAIAEDAMLMAKDREWA